MANVKIQSNALGTGTLTIAAPNTNSNRTLTLPDVTGTVVSTGDSGSVSQAMVATGVAGTGPAFSATSAGTQTVTSNVYTKVTLTETLDTNNNFASSTFTPTVAGYYQFNLMVVGTTPGGSMTNLVGTLYKNGSVVTLIAVPPYTSSAAYSYFSYVMYMNGTTDYADLYIRIVGTGTPTLDSGTYFQGFLLRAA